ncbi:MAG: hypothetical protein HFI20_05460 [Lachnospiraceae bacterium]|jgi:hypothetical protein|nr:hypothetical protein [Lachnospiraceae bacterium]
MLFTEDGYKILHDVQKKCTELNQKIDSIIRIMEIMTAYMQYSNMASGMSEGFDASVMADFISNMTADSEDFSPPPMPEGSETMNPNDFQKIMNAAKNSNQQMSQAEFNQIFETLKQGKSPEEVARMEQMVQLARSFMK